MGRVWFLRTSPWPPRWWTYEGAVKADFLLAATVLRQFVHQADESAGIVPNAPQAAPASPPGGPGIEENSQTAETRARRRLEKVIYFARYRGAKGNAGRSEPTTFNLALLLQRNNKHAEAVEYWRRYLANDAQSEWAARARRSLKFCEMQLQHCLSPRSSK